MIYTNVAQLVEHWSPKPAVVGSSPTIRAWPVRLGVRTVDFQSINTGSNPVRVTIKLKHMAKDNGLSRAGRGNCKGSLLDRRRDDKIAKQYSDFPIGKFAKQKYSKRRRRDFNQRGLHLGELIIL